MTGWIKLHRQIMEHWIWEDSKRFKWWMEILLLTNHTDKSICWRKDTNDKKRLFSYF